MDHHEAPGDFSWAARENGDITSMLFLCPACGSLHGIPVMPFGNPGWGWDGNKESPTLTPSISIAYGHAGEREDCRWHGWLTNGEWITA